MAKSNKKNTATLAEVAATHISEPSNETPATEQVPVEFSSTPVTIEGKQIVLMDTRLTQLTDGWGKQQKRDAVETVKFAIEKMVGAAESRISVGERFNKFAEKYPDGVNVLIKETSKLGINGLTETNIRLWMIRAREMPKYFPTEKSRRYMLALSGGEGVIIRDESFNQKDADGKPLPKPYILSPYWAETLKKLPVPQTDNEEVAELWARKANAQATFLRSKARTAPVESRIQKRFADFTKFVCSDGTIGKHEELVFTCLRDMMKRIINETEDLSRVEDLIGFMDKYQTGESEANGQHKAPASTKAAAKVA